MKRKLRRNLLALIISWIVWSPFNSMTRSYSQLFQKELGATPMIITVISSTFAITFATSKIFGGYITDKYGRRRILVRGTFLAAFSSLTYALAPSWEVLLIGSIIRGASLMYQPALRSIIADSTRSEFRGRVYALINFIPGLISALSPLIAVYLILTFGLIRAVRLMYIACFFGGIIAAIVRYILIEETLEGEVKSFNIVESYRDALKFIHKKLSGVFVLKFFTAVGYSLTLLKAYYIVYFLGLTEEDWGYLTFWSSLTSLLISIPFGYFIDKAGRKPALILCITFSSIGSAILYLAPLKLTPIYLVALISVILHSISSSGSFSAFPSVLVDLTPLEKRGRVNTLMSILEDLVSASIGLLTGYIYETFNPRTPFLLSTLFYLIGIIIALFFIKETKN